MQLTFRSLIPSPPNLIIPVPPQVVVFTAEYNVGDTFQTLRTRVRARLNELGHGIHFPQPANCKILFEGVALNDNNINQLIRDDAEEDVFFVVKDYLPGAPVAVAPQAPVAPQAGGTRRGTKSNAKKSTKKGSKGKRQSGGKRRGSKTKAKRSTKSKRRGSKRR